jgi:GT2 family glycosyltransferase/peptidoglycan/xylan/chitin deacetylase (PgdA/CDA1 family)
MNDILPHVAVLIVGYGNPEDIRICLTALARATTNPSFDIYICENAGIEAFAELYNCLVAQDGLCEICQNPTPAHDFSSDRFAELKCLKLKGRATVVWLARSTCNLGYAGGINAWIKQLDRIPGWDGLWILNPDSEPHANALAALVRRAATSHKGMISSTLVPADHDGVVHSRGLRWNRILQRATNIGFGEPIRKHCDVEAVETSIAGPSGASMYVTRACVQSIGPMDERFFLYFEDLDWGIRAQQSGIAYAKDAIVPHRGGTTIGASTGHRARRSRLYVYLQHRNLLIFVRKHYPSLLLYANVVDFGYAFLYLAAGSPSNFITALRGILAGWSGEVGPPGTGHLRIVLSNAPRVLKRKAILAISLAYYCLVAVWRSAVGTVGWYSEPHFSILYYHGVGNNYRFEFARQMNLLRHTANVVAADFKGQLPTKRPNVAITFDDAFESILDNALPELSRCSFHTTIFVPVAVLGRAPNWAVDYPSMVLNEIVMTAEQIKSISLTAVTIGSHGLTHPFLSRIDKTDARYEIERSRDMLMEITGRKIDLFAFPYGDYDEYQVALCKSAGYKFVFTTAAANIDATDRKVVRGRVMVEPSDSKIEFFLKINGAYNWITVVKVWLGHLKRAATRISGADRDH